jgi:hypothetical protein
MMAADRIIRWTTAGAVLGVAAVAAAHGSVTLTGQLTTLLTGTQAALPGAKVTITGRPGA